MEEPKWFVIAENYNIFRRVFPNWSFYDYIGRLPDDLYGRYMPAKLILLGRYWRHYKWDDEVFDYCYNHKIEVVKLDPDEILDKGLPKNIITYEEMCQAKQ